jgi:lipoprotein-anchoring transpeptidase ErfK/SrfK
MNSSSRFLAFMIAAGAMLAVAPAQAQDRYGQRPPVVMSPDLSAPWVLQLDRQGARQRVVIREPMPQARQPMRRTGLFSPRQNHEPAVIAAAAAQQAQRPAQAPMVAMDPKFLPQQVAYRTSHKAGTIVIDTNEKFLYLVLGNGEARRYGVGVGKPGFGWKGSHKVTRKAEWPGWTPPPQMIAREKAKGRILPAHMPGGPENPLGARALYLGSTLYRIHGTNQPWTIGQSVSSGCFRMRNEDVTDLYERVSVGARVHVI